MLTEGWPGCTKNACYALSSLAAIDEGCKMVLQSGNFHANLQRLMELLVSNDDLEASWFAAM